MGAPQAWLVGGEAGATRLIEEFAAAACRAGAVVALGGCVGIGADGLPFAPFATALRLVAEGRANRQTAVERFISPQTAGVHVSNILGKPGVSGRGEAAAVAHRSGIFPGLFANGAGDRERVR